MDGWKTKISTKRILIICTLVFVICVSMTPKDQNSNGSFVALIGSFSFVLMVVCGIILIYQVISKRIFKKEPKKSEQSPKFIPNENFYKLSNKTDSPISTTNIPTNFIQKILNDWSEKKKQKILIKQEQEKIRIQKKLEQERLRIEEENERIRIKREKEYEQNNYSFGHYTMVDGVATIWNGETKPASFRVYNNKNRFEGVITRLTLSNNDGNFYITLTNTENNTDVTINEKEIETLFLVGSTRYNFSDLCRKILKIELSEMFSFASFIRNELFKPRLMLKLNPPKKVMFSYYYAETCRDVFLVSEYYKNNKGESFLKIQGSQDSNTIVIPTKKITTMIQFQDGKKIKLEDWLNNLIQTN